MARAALVLLTLGIGASAACSRSGPTAAPASAALHVDGAAGPAITAVPAAPPARPPHPPTCEVEISGTIRVPASARRSPPPLVFVTLGDCLAEKPRVVGFAGSYQGKFFVEVFVPWGSDLTLCAALEPTEKAPSRLYGKAPIAMHAEKEGEVEFREVIVDLAPGPPRAWPHRQGPPEE